MFSTTVMMSTACFFERKIVGAEAVMPFKICSYLSDKVIKFPITNDCRPQCSVAKSLFGNDLRPLLWPETKAILLIPAASIQSTACETFASGFFVNGSGRNVATYLRTMRLRGQWSVHGIHRTHGMVSGRNRMTSPRKLGPHTD